MTNITKTFAVAAIVATTIVSALSSSFAQSAGGSRNQNQSQGTTYEVPRDRGASNG